MPRYYFDVRNDETIALDEEGLELLDIEAVQEEAARAFADMARDAVNQSAVSTLAQRMAIEVRDNAGPVLQVSFTFAVDRPKD
ncbi:DUF6894 family protein [Bradyrhizobium sp. 31Argb]|uniref:DUF6894 family protein n=1 Tax=Bradyrhizobium sp. 31Argb TaxID=3141247 RepID=UPI00102E38EF|nr:hypothetical protein [Bradyrhizobium sp. Leo170]TAI62687.1 hypothetical protein CWO89_28385 [Bradyrhizobium sp. Leo170]